jgi:hypothetical protein
MEKGRRPAGGSEYRRKLPFRGRGEGEGRAGGELRLRGLHPRGVCRGATLAECLPASHSNLFEDESSRRGKAGAAWGWPPHGAPPSIPRRQPRWAPSSPLSESARLLGKAGVSVPVGSPSRGLLGKRALTPSAYFESFVSGGRASRSSQRLRCSRTLYRKETLA